MVYSNTKRVASIVMTSVLAAAIAGCGGAKASEQAQDETPVTSQAVQVSAAQAVEAKQEQSTTTTTTAADANTSLASMVTDGVIDTSSLFTERDLQQEVDLVGATYLSLTSGKDVTITSEGVYVLVGDVEDVTVLVDADAAKVQLVLDGVSISNTDAPAIYVKNADKVFVTSTSGSENVLSVTGAFTADGDTNTDAVIFSKDDLVLNGTGSLTINSTDNGISSKDDLKVTGGSYVINCSSDALEANDSIRIADGNFTITTSKDALHSENDEDDSKGFVYICGGNFTIEAADDGIHGTTYVQIDDGSFTISGQEAIEATYVQVNNGNISISASDDGINASQKSSQLTPTIDIRGGQLSITMAQGDTDALDSNGYLYVSGGNIEINGPFAFDFEWGSEFTGGTIYVNGEQVTEITESMMGPGMGGGMMGGHGGMADPGMGGPGGMADPGMGGPGGGMGGPRG